MSGTNGGMPSSGLQNMGFQQPMGMNNRIGSMPMQQQMPMPQTMMQGGTGMPQQPQAIPPAFGGGQQPVQMGQNQYPMGMQNRMFGRQY